MKILSVLIIFFFMAPASLLGQKDEPDLPLKVLRLNTIGKEYKFNTIDSSETYLTYLGKLKTKDGEIFKILTSKWIWGLSRRATSKILVFDINNNYLGSYYLTMTYDFHKKIERNRLKFLNTDADDCDKKLVTKVSFDEGIPDQFFRQCKNKQGDIYSFSYN